MWMLTIADFIDEIGDFAIIIDGIIDSIYEIGDTIKKNDGIVDSFMKSAI
jgi:hypothetical protein